MTAEEREHFFDTEIGPELLRLGKLCEDNGLSLVAVCEWEPGETCRTTSIRKGSGFGIRMVDAAAQAHGNVDAFMIPMQRYAHQHGHSSVVMTILGVPTEPSEPVSKGDER